MNYIINQTREEKTFATYKTEEDIYFLKRPPANQQESKPKIQNKNRQ